jgi:hypothetical protein
MDILMIENFPRLNTIWDLARKFTCEDVHHLAEVVLDIVSSLVASEVKIAEKTYEGFRGFNPLLGILKRGRMHKMPTGAKQWGRFGLEDEIHHLS